MSSRPLRSFKTQMQDYNPMLTGNSPSADAVHARAIIAAGILVSQGPHYYRWRLGRRGVELKVAFNYFEPVWSLFLLRRAAHIRKDWAFIPDYRSRQWKPRRRKIAWGQTCVGSRNLELIDEMLERVGIERREAA